MLQTRLVEMFADMSDSVNQKRPISYPLSKGGSFQLQDISREKILKDY